MGKYIDLTGQKFGMLTVIKYAGSDKNGCSKWYCDCDCGTKNFMTSRQSLIRHKNPNCGCVRIQYLNIEGVKSGRLTAIKMVGKTEKGNNLWLCKCECGNTVIEQATVIRNGFIKSCGCLTRERASSRGTHHQSRTPLYKTWLGLKDRCLNPNSKSYKNYGGRGITVCDEWALENGSINFCNWALENGYKEGLELDRIDVNKGYSPDNCRWVSHLVQANNRRTTRYITYKGEKKSLAEWCRIYAMPYKSVQQRLTVGWDFDKAITTPIKKQIRIGSHISSDEVMQSLFHARDICSNSKEQEIISKAIKEIENLP